MVAVDSLVRFYNDESAAGLGLTLAAARVLRHWPPMEQIVADRPTDPWIYMLNENGVDEYVPRDTGTTTGQGASPS